MLGRFAPRPLARFLLRLTIPALFLMDAGSAFADDFYKGKTISVIIDGAGSFDTYARILARYMPKYIPGEPNMIVKSMVGATGLKAANYMYNVAPKDGTEIASVHGHIPTLPLFSQEGAQYDPVKFGWLGNVSAGLYVAYAWRTSPVQSMEEAMEKPMIVGGQSAGAMPVDVAILSNAMIGTKLKLVTGYTGAPEAKLAVQRGEINGEWGTLITTIRLSNPEWLTNGDIKIIASFGAAPRQDLPGVPLLLDYVKDPRDRAALALYLSRQATDKPYLAPPGIPADRLAILRKAFEAAVHDRAFVADAEKAGLVVDEPMNGEALAAFVAKAVNDPAAREEAKRVTAILDAFGKK